MIAFTERWRETAPRAPVRDRRRRRQGGPLRPAGAPGDGQPGAALGDRLQVPARAGRDASLEDIVPYVGRTGIPHAGRVPAAGQGRGLDRRPRDPPQPRRGAAQGRPDRRHRRAPEGRRRDPRGRPADAREAPADAREFDMPGGLPGLRDPDRPRRGRRPPLLPQPGLPGARVAGVPAFRRPRRDGHRGRGLGGAHAAPPARPREDARATSTGSPSRTWSRSIGSRARAPRTCTPRSSARRRRPLGRVLNGLGIPQVGETTAIDLARWVDAPGAARSRARTGWRGSAAFLREASRRRAGPVRAGGRGRRGPGSGRPCRAARWFADETTPRAGRAVGGGHRARAARAAPRRGRRGGPLEGQDGRRDAGRSKGSAARRRRRRSARPAASRRARCRRRRTTSSPARAPARSWPEGDRAGRAGPRRGRLPAAARGRATDVDDARPERERGIVARARHNAAQSHARTQRSGPDGPERHDQGGASMSLRGRLSLLGAVAIVAAACTTRRRRIDRAVGSTHRRPDERRASARRPRPKPPRRPPPPASRRSRAACSTRS